MAKQSLLQAVYKHIEETFLGKKYYCVLLSRPNMHVKGTESWHPYETSSDIFFSYEEAKAYYDKMHDTNADAVFCSHKIISFRSHEKIPVWNMQREHAVGRGNTLLY